MAKLEREKIVNSLTDITRDMADNIKEVDSSIILLNEKKMPGVAKMLELALNHEKQMLEKLEYLKTEILMNV